MSSNRRGCGVSNGCGGGRGDGVGVGADADVRDICANDLGFGDALPPGPGPATTDSCLLISLSTDSALTGFALGPSCPRLLPRCGLRLTRGGVTAPACPPLFYSRSILYRCLFLPPPCLVYLRCVTRDDPLSSFSSLSSAAAALAPCATPILSIARPTSGPRLVPTSLTSPAWGHPQDASKGRLHGRTRQSPTRRLHLIDGSERSSHHPPAFATPNAASSGSGCGFARRPHLCFCLCLHLSHCVELEFLYCAPPRLISSSCLHVVVIIGGAITAPAITLLSEEGAVVQAKVQHASESGGRNVRGRYLPKV